MQPGYWAYFAFKISFYQYIAFINGWPHFANDGMDIIPMVGASRTDSKYIAHPQANFNSIRKGILNDEKNQTDFYAAAAR